MSVSRVNVFLEISEAKTIYNFTQMRFQEFQKQFSVSRPNVVITDFYVVNQYMAGWPIIHACKQHTQLRIPTSLSFYRQTDLDPLCLILGTKNGRKWYWTSRSNHGNSFMRPARARINRYYLLFIIILNKKILFSVQLKVVRSKRFGNFQRKAYL